METVKGPDSRKERIEGMVVRYQLPLLKLCYAYLHDEELAKDAVQETFIWYTDTRWDNYLLYAVYLAEDGQRIWLDYR